MLLLLFVIGYLVGVKYPATGTAALAKVGM
jgi:hypothetical protein